jgi:hypothetical protein
MRLALPVLALAALATLFALTGRRGAGAVEASAASASSMLQAGVGTAPALPQRAAWVGPLPEPAAVAAAPAPAGAAPSGLLRGQLLDAEGQPLLTASLGLSRSEEPTARRGARADAAGFYEVADLAPGLWRLELRLTGPRGRACQVPLGAVEVPAGGTAWRDVRLDGARSITGVLRLADEDGLVLTLLLRRAAETERIVARTEAVLDATLERGEAAREAAFARGARNEDPGEIAARAISGEFWFAGLPPDLYELEIRLDAEGVLKQVRRVDLTRSDADLGVEHLLLDDFLP